MNSASFVTDWLKLTGQKTKCVKGAQCPREDFGRGISWFVHTHGGPQVSQDARHDAEKTGVKLALASNLTGNTGLQ